MHELSAKMVNDILCEKFAADCFGGGVVMGSMFYLDFGAKVLINTRSRGLIEAGESSLIIRDCDWALSQEGTRFITAEDLTRELFAEVVYPKLAGCSISGIETLRSATVIRFTKRDCELELTTDHNLSRSDDESVIAELRLRDGSFLQLLVGGAWQVST